MNYLISTIKSWNIENYQKYFKARNNFFLIKGKAGLTYNKIKKIDPKYIFFPHWSWIIPGKIWNNFECVVFHMTDLPYGRGGSPLQNLIVRGHKKTKISAIRVCEDVDAGDVYLKRSLSLTGSADDIYKRCSKIIFTKMIPEIINGNLQPKKQNGKITNFERRRPEQSKIFNNANLEKVYDMIRMLDADGYPNAFLETSNLKFDFTNVNNNNNNLSASVKIYEK